MMLAAETPAERALAADLAALLEERDPAALATGSGRYRDKAAGDPPRRTLDADRARSVGHTPHRVTAPAPSPGAGQSRGRRRPGPAARRRVPRPHRGQRRGEPGSFRFSGGGGRGCRGPTKLASTPLLVAAALDVKSGRPISASPPRSIPRQSAAIGGGPGGSSRSRPGSILVSGSPSSPAAAGVWARWNWSDRTVPVDPAEVAVLLANAVADQRLAPLKPSGSVQQFRARVALDARYRTRVRLAGSLR